MSLKQHYHWMILSIPNVQSSHISRLLSILCNESIYWYFNFSQTKVKKKIKLTDNLELWCICLVKEWIGFFFYFPKACSIFFFFWLEKVLIEASILVYVLGYRMVWTEFAKLVCLINFHALRTKANINIFIQNLCPNI